MKLNSLLLILLIPCFGYSQAAKGPQKAAPKITFDAQKCDETKDIAPEPLKPETWSGLRAMSINGLPYKLQKVAENCFIWVPDVEASQRQLEAEAKENARKDELYLALRTRVLTVKEWEEVVALGEYLLVHFHGGTASGNFVELERRLNEAYLQQFKLRMAAEKYAIEATSTGLTPAASSGSVVK